MFRDVTLSGRIGSDVGSRTTRNHSTITILSLATYCLSQSTWHKCVSFGCAAEYANLTMGALLRIIGGIQKRKYVANDGAKKSVTGIPVLRIAWLDRARKPASTERAAV